MDIHTEVRGNSDLQPSDQASSSQSRYAPPTSHNVAQKIDPASSGGSKEELGVSFSGDESLSSGGRLHSLKGRKVEVEDLDLCSEVESLFPGESSHSSIKELERLVVRKFQQLEMRQERRKKEMKKLGQKFEGSKVEVGDSSSEDESLSSVVSLHSLKEMRQERRKKEMKKLGQKFEGSKEELGVLFSGDESLSSGGRLHSLKGRKVEVEDLDLCSEVESLFPGESSHSSIKELKRYRDEFKKLVRERQQRVRELQQLKMKHERRIKEIEKLAQTFEGSKVEVGDSSSEDKSLSSGESLHSLKGLKYTRRLQNASSKSEKLKIFTEMHAVGEALSDTIATYVETIDMSNVTLTYTDLQALGFIINYSTTLSIVNLRNCQLPPGSIAQLGYSIESNVVINEFNIEKNPNLNVEDLIAGIKLCVREGRECNFICDVSQLGKKDKKVFKAVVLQYTETSPQSTKSRRALAMESRLQMPQVSVSRYKMRSGKSYSIGFQGKASYSISQLQQSKTDQISTDVNVETVNTEKLKTESLEKSPDDSTNEYSTQSKEKRNVTKYKPRTVAESVKYRKMQRFQSILSTLEETSESSFHSKLDKSVKIAALASNRTRFQALAMKTTKSAGLRSHVKDTHSTILSTRKSTNKDSGFQSFSHFSSAASIKSIQKKLSRLNTKEDRSKRSEHSMTDNVNTDSAHGSFGSSEKLDVSRKRNDYDPKMLEWQRFEMTCKYGLGVMQNKTEKIEKWLNNLESQIEVTTEDEDIRWSEPGHMDFLEMKLDNALRKPEVVYATMGEEGGEVKLSSFKIYFPPGAVKEEKNFFFKSCSIPDEQQSEDFFPITPVLTCRLIGEPCNLGMNTKFPLTFAEPVKITMKTFCSPKHADVPVTVFHTNDKCKSGRQIRSQKVILGQLGAIEIEVVDFCNFKAEVAMEQLNDMEFRIMNNVSIENTKRVTSYFWKDERIISANDLSKTGSPIVTGFPLPEEIIVSLNSIVSLTMKCEKPNDTEVAPINHSFRVTKKWLKKRHHLEYFRLEELEHDSCRLEIQYTIEATDPDDENDIRGPLPIIVDWPIKQNVPLSETAGPSKSEKNGQRPMQSMRTGDVKADSYIGTQTTNNYTLKVDNAQNIPPALLGIQPKQLAIKELDTTKK